MRLPNVTDMKGVDAAFIGIPFDTAVSYRIGGRFGPAAIREASRLLRPYNVEQGIPTKAASTPFMSLTLGSRMKVPIPVNLAARIASTGR